MLRIFFGIRNLKNKNKLLEKGSIKKMISLGSNACLRSKTYKPNHPPTPHGGISTLGSQCS